MSDSSKTEIGYSLEGFKEYLSKDKSFKGRLLKSVDEAISKALEDIFSKSKKNESEEYVDKMERILTEQEKKRINWEQVKASILGVK